MEFYVNNNFLSFIDFNGFGLFNACQQFMAIGGPYRSRVSIGYSIRNVIIEHIETFIIMKRKLFLQRILSFQLSVCSESWPGCCYNVCRYDC